ncbi:hypothetical protein J3A83DRAFT_1646087 [Scleroderma citrinum]
MTRQLRATVLVGHSLSSPMSGARATEFTLSGVQYLAKHQQYSTWHSLGKTLRYRNQLLIINFSEVHSRSSYNYSSNCHYYLARCRSLFDPPPGLHLIRDPFLTTHHRRPVGLPVNPDLLASEYPPGPDVKENHGEVLYSKSPCNGIRADAPDRSSLEVCHSRCPGRRSFLFRPRSRPFKSFDSMMLNNILHTFMNKGARGKYT